MLEGKVIGTWELKATLKFWWYVKTKQEGKKEAKAKEMKIQLLRWEKATQKSKLRVEEKIQQRFVYHVLKLHSLNIRSRRGGTLCNLKEAKLSGILCLGSDCAM